MKKFILILMAVIGLFAISQAQGGSTPLSFTDATLDSAETIYSKAVRINSNDIVNGAYELTTDSVSGTPSYTATVEYSLSGSKWSDAANFADVTTTTGVDTNFIVTNANAMFGRWYRVKIVAKAATAQSSTVSGYFKYAVKR